MTDTDEYDNNLIEIDKLARGLYAAHLEMVEGFDPEGAERISLRQCPDSYYELAEDLRAEFPAFRGDDGRPNTEDQQR
jgi:hypothetical protein